MTISRKKRILVCPLFWGMGHTIRMIPVIKELQKRGHTVILGANQKQAQYIRKEIPDLHFLFFPGFTIKYSRILPQYIVILINLPRYLFYSVKEHILLKKIIKNHDIDIVISDSRAGLWNKNIISVFFTHLIRIPFPRKLRFLENLFLPLNRMALKNFTFCFIPDLPGEVNLSGRLSHELPLPANARFTGVLSRFKTEDVRKIVSDKNYFCTVILSGPSPQKELFSEQMKHILCKTDGISVIAGETSFPGLLEKYEGKIKLAGHLTSEELYSYISQSKHVVARAGYTTIMELFSAGIEAIIIPTPGQPEQEYLAKYLSERKWFVSVNQKDLIQETFPFGSKTSLPEFPCEENQRLFSEALDELLDEKHNNNHNCQSG